MHAGIFGQLWCICIFSGDQRTEIETSHGDEPVRLCHLECPAANLLILRLLILGLWTQSTEYGGILRSNIEYLMCKVDEKEFNWWWWTWGPEESSPNSYLSRCGSIPVYVWSSKVLPSRCALSLYRASIACVLHWSNRIHLDKLMISSTWLSKEGLSNGLDLIFNEDQVPINFRELHVFLHIDIFLANAQPFGLI